ncbi:MAG TPA: 3-hydroxyacyl-CoA dehydrogenase family protein [Solirubrobacteraceae bacterium]|jgi:3-hydroxybutyryl-CoA dehydrogenase|nr:3-hydroxyacyl-CoA dehydrogenase family protein [Solirubrobacteraceae bacterium]
MSGERVAIVGAGLMGHGLAQVFAHAGHDVAITDADPDRLTTVRERIAGNLAELGLDPAAAERVQTHEALPAAVGSADVVIEAVSENLELKQAVFAQLEAHCRSDALLATNTSVIPVTSIGEGLSSAERMLGTHWWNPPYLIGLVEVVQAPRTAPDTVTRMMDLLTRVGKEPVHVRRDVPGFVGNRLQHALWREAIAIVAAGICDAETVDVVVRSGFGKRLAVMGPMENADLVGLDLTLAIHEQVLPDLDRTPGPAPRLRELVARGDLGMKTGQGFQSWPAGAADEARQRLTRHLSA